MKRWLQLALSLSSSVFIILALVNPVYAGSFNQNRIIDDAVFDNANSMTAAQIDNWLNTNFGSTSCISTNHGFSAPDPIGYNPTQGFSYGGNVSAGQVIYDASQAYGINPQVLLATLQKEQSLVDGSAGCSTLRYAAATGYGCPDGGTSYSYSGLNLYTVNGTTVTSVNGTCVNTSSKAGFTQQLIRSAWLLRFGEQRSEGNVNWAIIKGNWDNSDDPQSCYSGPMTEGTWQRCPSGASAYYDGYTTIDGVSVHLDDGATAALYWYTPHFAGNQNLYNIFTNWFGDTTLAYAFKSPTDSTIYLYIDGYKISVPAMGILQDYGFSPESIKTLSQSFVDSIPVPPSTSGVSPNISYIVKSPSDTDADGGSIYLISVGKRYAFTTMQQFTDFGFSTSAIAYLPLSYIQSIPNGGSLSNYIKSPNGQVFQVSGGLKRVIFDYPTFISLNSTGASTFVSYFDADLIPSGNPLANSPILVKTQGSEIVYLYASNTYYGISGYDTYACWGFDTTLHIPVYRVANNSYLATISPSNSISCLVNDSGNTELLAGTTRLSMPSSYGFTGATLDANTQSIVNQLPLRSSPIKQYVQPTNDNTVWYLDNGTKKQVPTYADFTLLKLTSTQIDTISSNALNTLAYGGVKLGQGQIVKSTDAAGVYGIYGNSRIVYARSDDFIAYHNSWSSIEAYSANTLDTLYPFQNITVSPYFYNQQTNNVYFADPNNCYELNASLLASYGQDLNSIKTNQTYDGSLFPSLTTSQCVNGSAYVKQPGQALVYWIDNGQKHAINTWDKLVTKSGTTNPYVISLSAANVALFPTGTPL